MNIINKVSWAFAWVAKAVEDGQFKLLELAIKSLDPDWDRPGRPHSILPADGQGWVGQAHLGSPEAEGYYPVAYALQERCYCSTPEEAAGLIRVLDALQYMYPHKGVYSDEVYILSGYTAAEIEPLIPYLWGGGPFTLRQLAAASNRRSKEAMAAQEAQVAARQKEKEPA